MPLLSTTLCKGAGSLTVVAGGARKTSQSRHHGAYLHVGLQVPRVGTLVFGACARDHVRLPGMALTS